MYHIYIEKSFSKFATHRYDAYLFIYFIFSFKFLLQLSYLCTYGGTFQKQRPPIHTVNSILHSVLRI